MKATTLADDKRSLQICNSGGGGTLTCLKVPFFGKAWNYRYQFLNLKLEMKCV